MDIEKAIKWAYESDWGSSWENDCKAMVALAEEVQRLRARLNSPSSPAEGLEELARVGREAFDEERWATGFSPSDSAWENAWLAAASAIESAVRKMDVEICKQQKVGANENDAQADRWHDNACNDCISAILKELK